ncbi:hypothetical protein [Methylobacterium goesingense]|uniref:Porin n=1 Tax=Methylobacterium goesingense TaxID=243690 RepID=A0ABV2LFT6_9HYPH
MPFLRPLCGLVPTLVLLSASASAAGASADPSLVRRHAPVAPFTFPCGTPGACGVQAGPGPADRDVRPFEGTLGRPCAYRTRATPEGTRKVRVCF